MRTYFSNIYVPGVQEVQRSVLTDIRGRRTDIRVVGISAKTGQNISELLKVIREMYDEGDRRTEGNENLQG